MTKLTNAEDVLLKIIARLTSTPTIVVLGSGQGSIGAGKYDDGTVGLTFRNDNGIEGGGAVGDDITNTPRERDTGDDVVLMFTNAESLDTLIKAAQYAKTKLTDSGTWTTKAFKVEAEDK